MSENETPKKKKFYFSFSSMSKLIRDPKAFYKEYILGEYDDTSKKILDEGSLAHQLTLDPERFNENIVVMNCKIPSDALRAVIDKVYKLYGEPIVAKNPDKLIHLRDFKKEILDELVKADLYQSLADSVRADKAGNKLTGDEKRLEKVITDDNVTYFATLGTAYKKTIVDFTMIEKAQKKSDAIWADPKAADLLTEKEGEKLVMEYDLKCELPGYPFGLRGIIDSLKIIQSEKKIIITDLKTTTKTLQLWKDDFENSPWMYWLQPIIYKELILSFLPKEEIGNWKLEVNFIVIDCNNDVYCFPVQPGSLAKWEQGAKKTFDIAEWHLKENKYNLPYEFLNGLVTL